MKHRIIFNLLFGLSLLGWTQPQMTNSIASPNNSLRAGSGLRATSIAAGGGHTCVIDHIGKVWCWGLNNYGQLGNGTTIDSNLPIVVKGLTENAQSVVAGSYHTCIVTIKGKVWCWGRNNFGQLGNGKNSNSPVPSLIAELDQYQVIFLGAGQDHTCAIDGRKSKESVWCWGFHMFGRSADNQSGGISNTPVVIRGFEQTNMLSFTPVLIDGGAKHSCLMAQETYRPSVIFVGQPNPDYDQTSQYCWGENSFNQISNSKSQTLYSTPSFIFVGLRIGPANSRRISSLINLVTGGYQSCVILNYPNFHLECAGQNNLGQVGNESFSETSNYYVTTKIPVAELDKHIITSGYSHSCMINDSNTLLCWGANHLGQLGDSTLEDRNKPISVTGLSKTITAISASKGSAGLGQFANGFRSIGDHTCAILEEGGVMCWGDNRYGQLGNGSNASLSTVPVSVIGFGPIRVMLSMIANNIDITGDVPIQPPPTTPIAPIPTPVVDRCRQVLHPDCNEPNDGFETAKSLPQPDVLLYGTLQGSLNGDKKDVNDFFKLQLEAGNTFIAKLSALAETPAESTLDLYVYDPDKQPVRKVQTSGANKQIVFTSDRKGTYYIVVSAFDAPQLSIYQLELRPQ